MIHFSRALIIVAILSLEAQVIVGLQKDTCICGIDPKLMDKLEELIKLGLDATQSCQTKPDITEDRAEHEQPTTNDGAESPETSQIQLDELVSQPANQSDQQALNVAVANFLAGLANQSANSEALSKLNSSAKIDTSEMENALKLTVPQLVSNIFSSIQSFSLNSHQSVMSINHSIYSTINSEEPKKLVSIDGSSVNVSSQSNATEMADQGEKLFTTWLDHYLAELQVTASMANHIRKNAATLFRRILVQYIRGVEKMGGNIQDNVRSGIQMALSNTQTLTTFLLRNYINFSAGLMQLIGDQVSRVGKRIDTTGDAISHISLNPFDIVSSVLDTLPNPSDLSKYFKSMGKYLIGETASPSDQPSRPTTANDHKPLDTEHKTIGNIGKTLTSWIG